MELINLPEASISAVLVSEAENTNKMQTGLTQEEIVVKALENPVNSEKLSELAKKIKKLFLL